MRGLKAEVVTLVAVLGLAMIGLGFWNQQVSASSWHVGAPAILKGHWITKKYLKPKIWAYPPQKYLRSYFYVNNKGFGETRTGGNGAPLSDDSTYRYLGHHRYKLLEHLLGGGYIGIKVKVSRNGYKMHVYHEKRMFYKR